MYLQCSGVAMINEPAIQQCCFIYQENFHFRQPGDSNIYHRKEAELQCKKGWTGRNCDSCAPKFEPPGNCSRCHNGWVGDNCDVCGFGFNAESNCTECIQNGLWTGTVNEKNLTVRLTFTGYTCSTVEPGKFPNATHTMIAYY